VTSSSISGGATGQIISIILKQGSSTTTAPASAPTYSTSTTGGFLPPATSYFAKCAYLYGTVESLPSAEATETTGSGSTNTITWNCPAGGGGVTSYKFYFGTGTGAEDYYFTSSTDSYTQTSVPSAGTPGIPFTGSTYTVVWPANLVNAPTMASGIGATTGLTAVFDGTNWQVIGVSAATSSAPTVQHLTITSGFCTTANTAYANCNFSASFANAFADTNYSVVCGLSGAPTATTITGVWAVPTSTTAFTVTIQNGAASGAMATTPTRVDCIGGHS
jgi:hypothetical protein